MTRHHFAKRLPVELLSIVFDSLSIGELLVCSHISIDWRTVALRHRTFWRDITLAVASPSAVDFFRARLDAGSSRSVIVRLYYVPSPDFPPDQRSVVLNAVTRNLYRIDRLHVEIDISFDQELFLALNLPAPRLDTLDLTVMHDSEVSDALPIDLFASQAPRLRYVRLTNLRLHPDRLPDVFSPIIELRYCFTEALSFPVAVFSHCPALENLFIYGKSCPLRSTENEQCVILSDNLRFVEVAVFEGSTEFMQRLPCASIPKVTVALQDLTSVHDLLGHLRGRLELRADLESDTGNLSLHYLAPDSGMQRTFLCSPLQATESSLPTICTCEDLTSRVQSVELPASCSGLLAAFDEMTTCTRVALSLQDGQPLEPPPRRLALPKLECVELSSAPPLLLDAGELGVFLDAAFAPGSEPVQIALTGVTLRGDLAAFPRDRFVIPSVLEA